VNTLRRIGLLATQALLWIVVTWLAYAAWDGLVHLRRDSIAEAAFLVKVDLIVTAIFVALAAFLLFLIGTVRGKLAQQKDRNSIPDIPPKQRGIA